MPTSAWVERDPILLKRILANLASNAVRYTEHGGVVIGARRRRRHLSLETWDSGVGIPATECDHIFEEFYQIGARGARAGQGMGLGLAIIRRLATLLDDPVRVRWRSGKGSCFTVEVPRAMPHPVSRESRPPLAVTSAMPLAGSCIAVVDDELVVLEGMRALLDAWGAAAIGASSGDAILSALGEAETYPDLVIADYRLAQDELSTDVVARVRHELGIPIPALLISGDSSAETLETLRRSGIEFLLKPVLPEELKAHALRLCAPALRRRSSGAFAPAGLSLRLGPVKRLRARPAEFGTILHIWGASHDFLLDGIFLCNSYLNTSLYLPDY